MTATQTTRRPVTARMTRHMPGRVAGVGRVAFGVMFTGGAAVHVAIVVTGTETYRQFADTAFLPFVKQAWLSVFMPHAALLGLLLAAFELTVGLLILAGGRKTTLGLLGTLAFHLGLMLFGWGFWFWSIPMLAVLVALLHYDFGKPADGRGCDEGPGNRGDQARSDRRDRRGDRRGAGRRVRPGRRGDPS